MKKCIYCSSEEIFEIKSLKHRWIFCNKCKNTKSISKKNKTLFNYISWLLILLNKILKKKNYLIDVLCYTEKSPEESYLYYKPILEGQKYENTKWWDYDTDFLKFLERNDINIKSKNLISISEEPGFIYNKIKNDCNDVVFTALNSEVATIMEEKLGVKTLAYNANTDDITKLVSKKFDIVLMRWVIGHVDDLEKFIQQIKKITHNDSIIFCNFQTSSLQLSIVFGYDDYTFSGLYDESYVVRLFEKNNFYVQKKYIYSEDILKKYYSNFLKKIIFVPLYQFFKFLSFLTNKKENFDKHFIIEKKVSIFFRKK
tara:strand:- start:635 stop:1573 length:939 start_codon:yes stop_codon:yes gene_type:complete